MALRRLAWIDAFGVAIEGVLWVRGVNNGRFYALPKRAVQKMRNTNTELWRRFSDPGGRFATA